MSAAAKLQLSAGASNATSQVDSLRTATVDTTGLLRPVSATESAEARGFLSISRSGPQQGGGSSHGGPSRGGRPQIPQNPGRVPPPHYPPHGPRLPYPLPAPIPRWPAPFPFPNRAPRLCLPNEIPDYYDRLGQPWCYNWWLN